ncbi:ABC1 kinase family protein [Glaciibacter psychrotolerans]|uniref:Ubiquinone biosynthesis protein n=1 Tax=Glaciibacter psychrotolerans TaxID=670054 RepID=A0A7Z0EBB3_9MICO|nr:AarF/UbiB family protein [Leifsonia psychrotolerans]NYJ18450.1 ubiquinone biosynthesis protein [Leifsonia psychrotolerans]
MGAIIWELLLVGIITIVFMMVLAGFARRFLGVRIGLIRLVIAGVLGLGAEVGFESQFVWGKQQYSLALLPLQFGIILFVAVAFLVLAEILVPPGSIPRPDQWLPSLTSRFERTRRYAEISRIALRQGLVPFRLNTEPTAAGSAERTRQARALRGALESAGGAFVKLGQLLSTRTDILPVEFLAELSQLQQRVPPAKWTDVRALLEAELAGSVEEHFSSFDETPLAAASIGQVHRATLKTGERVAVKVQRPGIIPLIDRDIDIMIRLATQFERTTAWGKDLGVQGLAETFAASLRDEVDYRIEAGNMAAMALTQAKHNDDERVGIPRHFAQLCTSKVLVMELVDGDTLSDPRAFLVHSAAERDEQAGRLLRSTLTQIIDDGVFHADLHPGNIILRPDGEIVLLDFGSVGRLDSQLRAQIGAVLLAFYRGDAGAFTDALLAFVELPDEIDETSLRRQIGVFVATRLGPGASLDVTVFTEMVRMLTENRIAVPSELATAFRAVATVEGTLRHLSPGFDMLSAAGAFAQDRIKRSFTPGAAFTGVRDEFLSLAPLIRRLPTRIDRITGALVDGRFSVNVRLFADRRDRTLVRSLVNLVVVAFMAGTFGIMAAMLLISDGGPVVTPTLSLFQVFGYLLVVLSGLLTLRVLFDVFRLQRTE